MKWLLTLFLTSLFIFNPATAQQFTGPGVFSIEGFSASQLVWQGLDDQYPLVLCELGVTPNRLALHNGYLYVVHSGSPADGTGAAVWRLQVEELVDDPVPVWQVLELPPSSNPWDIAFSGQDPQLAFVTLLMQHMVVFVDLDSWSTQHFVATQPYPEGIVELEGRLYVAASDLGVGDQVSVIDVATAQPVEQFTVGTNPQELLAGVDGLLTVLSSGIVYPADDGALIQWLDPLTGDLLDQLPLGNNSSVMAGRADGVIAVGDEWTAMTDPVLFCDGMTHELLPASYATGGFALAAGLDNCCYVGSALDGTIVRLDAEFNQIDSFNHGDAVVDLVEYNPLAAVAQAAAQPAALQLLRLAPNPFNPGTTLEFNLSGAAPVTVDLYDLLGRHRRQLSLGVCPAGNQRLTLDGSGLGSGVYFLRLQAGSASRTIKMTRLP